MSEQVNTLPRSPTTWKKKIVNDHVGIVYSPGFGGGWSTWVPQEKARALAMDSRIVTAVANRMPREELRERMEEWGYGKYKYLVAADTKLRVAWVLTGQYVIITNSDGNEHVRIYEDKPTNERV